MPEHLEKCSNCYSGGGSHLQHNTPRRAMPEHREKCSNRFVGGLPRWPGVYLRLGPTAPPGVGSIRVPP